MKNQSTPSGKPPLRRRAWHPALFGAVLLAPVLSVTTLAPGRAGESVASADSATPAGVDAAAALLRQARFWRTRGKLDRAQNSLTRLLAVDPRNADALALDAQLAIARGDRPGAEAALARLREAAPDDRRIGEIGNEIWIGPIPPDTLRKARALAADGRNAAAIGLYDGMLRGAAPPDDLAIEYFTALSGVAGGWERARDELDRLVRRDPADLPAQLAYARVLAVREATRAESLLRLRALVDAPASSAAASALLASLPTAEPDSAAQTPQQADASRQPAAAPPRVRTPDAMVATEASLRRAAAVRAADALNAQGRQADGFDALAPSLSARPNDPELNMALARLYLGAGRPHQALVIAEALLRRGPDAPALWRQAIDAALQAGERSVADQLAREALRRAPDDPQVWIASSSLARTRGDADAALGDLQRARELRARQLADADAPAAALWVGSPADVSPAASPSLTAPPPLDADPSAADGDQDPVVITGHMLDTDPTTLPLPIHDAPPPAYPPSPFAPRPPSGPPAQTTFKAIETPVAEPGAVAPTGLSGASAPIAAANPFRATPEPSSMPAAAPPPAPAAVPTELADAAPAAGAIDPMTAKIDDDIADITRQGAGQSGSEQAVGFRGRSGAIGTSQLGEITVPLAAQFAAGGDGQLKLAVTPTFLSAGSVADNVGARSQFGTLAIGSPPSGVAISRQTAGGAGLDASYMVDSVTADVGATPLGFQQENVVGGLEWAPTISDGVRLRITAERRAVTDSVLSYAGTKDPLTGAKWGGVTVARGRASLQFDVGEGELHVGGGGGALEGKNVESNSEWEAGAGGSYPVVETASAALRLGLDLVYYGYNKNLDGFTFGQGGYFSPQSYFAALLPATFRQQVARSLSYEIGGSAGVQTYRENSSPYYPTDATLQSQLAAQQANPATVVPGVATSYPSQNETGFAGGAHGSIDYRLTQNFDIGAKVDYEHTGNFNQTVGLLYGRYLLGPPPPE